MKYLGSYLYYLIHIIYKIMDRKEEINKEIDILEKRIISLKNERYDIIKKENPLYVGDCFKVLRMIGNVYYKIVKITDTDNIICIQVNHNSIQKNFFVRDSFMEKCSLQEFEEEYNRTLNYITKDE